MKAFWPTALALLVAPWLHRPASGQFISYNGAEQLVFGSRGLQQALTDPTVTGIILSGNVTLNASLWTSSPVITNRSVYLGGDENSAVDNVLNFGGLLGAIVVGDGGEVEFRNLTLSNPGPLEIGRNTTNYVNNRCVSLGIWPSLVVLDGATVYFNSSRLFYYSQIKWSRCPNFAAKIQYDLRQNQDSPNVSILPGNNASLIVSNFLNLKANITDTMTNRSVGEADLLTENTTMTCVDDPYIQDGTVSGSLTPTAANKGSGGFKWWYGLIIALGAVLLLLVIAAIAFVFIFRRRVKRKRSQDSEQASKAAMSRDVFANGSAPSNKLSPHGLDSSPTLSTPPPNSVAAIQTQHLMPQATLDGLRSVGASESAVSGSGPEMEAAPSGGMASSLGKGSGGPSESGAFSWSDVNALLRARSDFSDIEVGPLIGRGSFGRVYKGRWKGAFVAIKIVDHQEAASKVIAMREGALSHSVQHPNVITTYSVFLQRMYHQQRSDKEEWAPDRSPPDDAMEGIPERAGPSFTEEQEHFATCMVLEYADRGLLSCEGFPAVITVHPCMAEKLLWPGTLEKAVMSGKFHSGVTGLPDMKAIHRTLLDIAGGMDYLHSVGVLHGDLKGANVLLKSTATDPRGFSCKLADFGMARVLDTNRTHVSTQTYGTISYMPGELLREGRLTRAVDSYSFAILLWELFSGQMLHTGLTIAQVFYKVCYEQYKPAAPDSMPEEYRSLMIRCWDEDPMKRPTFSEIFEYLQGLQGGRAPPRGSLSASIGSRRGSESPRSAAGSLSATAEDRAIANGVAGSAGRRAPSSLESRPTTSDVATSSSPATRPASRASSSEPATTFPPELPPRQPTPLPNPFAAVSVKPVQPAASPPSSPKANRE